MVEVYVEEVGLSAHIGNIESFLSYGDNFKVRAMFWVKTSYYLDIMRVCCRWGREDQRDFWQGVRRTRDSYKKLLHPLDRAYFKVKLSELYREVLRLKLGRDVFQRSAFCPFEVFEKIELFFRQYRIANIKKIEEEILAWRDENANKF